MMKNQCLFIQNANLFALIFAVKKIKSEKIKVNS